MADSQVEAMRRAYAEIMLNMAKESAARVLAAERRAAALAEGVAAAKEDGVAALVRLKAIMEDRIKVVELQSLVHVKKIKELQDELSGTQNTVAFLSADLQRANAELEQTRKTLDEERINGLLPTCDKIVYNKNNSSRSKIHLENRNVSLKNKNTPDDTYHVPSNAKEDQAVENMENIYHCGSDLASFMARNKKPELYRNGCTQRIHALKQRSPHADTSLEQNSKQASAKNIHLKTGKNDTAKSPRHTRSIMEQILQTKFLANCKRKRGIRSRPSYYKHDNSGELGKTECKSFDASDGNGCLLLLQAFEQELPSAKVSTGHDGEGLADLKDDLLVDGKDADLNLYTATPELKDVHAVRNMQMKRRKRSATIIISEASHSESKSDHELDNTLLRSANENSMFNGEPSSELVDNCSDGPPGMSERGSEMIDNCSGTHLRNNGPVLHCTTENLMHTTDANTGEVKSEVSSPLSLQSTKSEIAAEGDVQVDYPGRRASEDNSTGWKEVNVDESCNLTSGRADASVVSSLDKEQNTKASSAVSMQAEGARYIKYTFNRRKRKSLCLDSTSQDTVPEKSRSLDSLSDKQECQTKPETQDLLIQSPRDDSQPVHVAPRTQDLLTESPRGDSQLVHVAQQLILLSKRKW